MSLGFYFNAKMCIGCRTCQIACKDRNGFEAGMIYRRVRSFETGVYPEARLYHYSGSCNHCEKAKCVEACPTGAMHYADDKTVQLDKNKCVGCGYCEWNCPYGVPQLNHDIGIAGKCDSCKSLRDAGKNPVCVDSCPMRCLDFGDLDQLKAKYGEDVVNEIPVLPSAAVTRPSILISPKNCALLSNFKEIKI